MKLLATFFTFMLLWVLVLIGGFVGYAYLSYQVGVDIDAWYDRAADTADPDDMHEYLSNTVEGLNEWGVISGYSSPLFPSPNNDAAIMYGTVLDQLEQSAVLQEMDRTSPEYQTGLSNLRDSINDVEYDTTKHVIVHQYPVLYWGWQIIIFLGVVILLGIMFVTD